jgi:Fe-Mn family superoxide dismutase
MSLAGGSGWVIVAYDSHRSELAHRVCSDHAHAGAFDVPLLVLDMYEHSYHLDHGADAARYVEAFVANVDWEAVDARVARTTARSSA